MIKKEQWLNHLIYATPVEGYGNRISSFLISLEAWRRGIGVKYYTIDNPDNKLLIRYSLTHNNRTLHFNAALSKQMSEKAFDICEDKFLTKKYLSENGIRVPMGVKIKKGIDLEYLVEVAEKLTYPLVMKPVNEKAGKGVFSNITDEEMLLEIFSHLTNDLGYKELLLEEFVEGEEHRILVVGTKVVGIVKRVPANILGNGKDTIKELIRAKNKSKKRNPVIHKKTIVIDREVENQLIHAGYELTDILEEGKRIFLRTKSNISAGGDPIDVMDEVDYSVIEMAENAVQAIPGLEVSGIDMIIDPVTKEKVIIEINTRPMIGIHVFPEGGKPRDVVKEIIDFYFPETKNIERSKLYFDFGRITRGLDGIATKEIDLIKITPQHYFAKRFLISIKKGKQRLRSIIRRKARSLGLYGHAKGAGGTLLEVVLASTEKENIENFFTNHLDGLELSYEITLSENWDYSINLGFKTANYSDNITLLESYIEDSKRKKEILTKKHQEKVNHLNLKLDKTKNQVSVYKKSYLQIEKEVNQLKEEKEKNQQLIRNQKKEIKKLKDSINNTLYRRLFKSKRI